jgi:hypothetical protein
MFAKGVAFLLQKFLGEFVEDGDKLQERIQLGAWSGLIVLEDLVLKSSILALLDIPIALSFASVGRFELNIPWGNLGVDPVSIIIDKINLLIEPKYEWNPGAADRREQAVKQAKLAAAEIFANQRLSSGVSQSYGNIAAKWLMTSVLNKIIDNIQITVREVHVRYEDQLSCPSNFCIGFSLESLHIQSRDGTVSLSDASPMRHAGSSHKNNDIFGKNETELSLRGFETFHKHVQLNHMAVYWNPLVSGASSDVCTCTFVGRSPLEIKQLMSRAVASRVSLYGDKPRHHYILGPVDINSFLDVSFNSTTGVVKVCFFCVFLCCC